MKKSEEMILKFKQDDIDAYRLLQECQLLCPVQFSKGMQQDENGNYQIDKNSQLRLGMIDNDHKSYYLAYTDYNKAQDIQKTLLVFNLHDYYQLFCQDDCFAQGIVLNLNSDNIIIDKAMVATFGHKASNKQTALSPLNIYPHDAIEAIRKYANSNRDLKACYLLNNVQDDILHFCFIVDGLKFNKIKRALHKILQDKLKNIPFVIVSKDDSNLKYCKQDILKEQTWIK
ncbi:MAG: SseB family protein [Erysipelotrichaceae bacterium]|nr:SseB family protein [Erysipelotrichaceae bacterium]MDY5251387.1 SseB family protein [Erysipelotrichaceae bacterium]